MKTIYLFLLCLTSVLAQAQVYDFPIKPGAKEYSWR